ncbi:MAG: baseplate J/gp47 family protein [Candidatus Dormibacter sp.]
MKTLAKLLYVEADEEITDLVDRLRDLSLEDAVTFVVPEGSRALQSPMSFRLLKRYADSYGKHINVISGDPRLQALSLEAGFSAYSSLQAYDGGAEVHRPGLGEPDAGSEVPVFVPPPSPRRESAVMSRAPRQAVPPASAVKKPPAMRDYRPYIIGAAVLAVLALVALVVYIPTAAATLSVQGTPTRADIQLIGATGTASGSPDHFATQAIQASESQTVQGTATGQKPVPAAPSTGTVTFTNNCLFLCDSGSKTIGTGTTVSTSDGKHYKTQKTVTVANPRGSASVAVAAVQPGPDGNTDAHTISVIDNNRDFNLSVDNSAATIGGADPRTATVIQQSDIDTIVAAYAKDTVPKVTDELKGKAPGMQIVPVGNGVQPTVAADHKVGDEVQSFNMTVTVAGAAVAFDDKAVKAKLRDALSRKVPSGSQLTANPTLTYDATGATADGNLTLNGHAAGSSTPVFLESRIRAHLKGQSPSSAHAFLQSLPNVVDARVTQAPFGLPWLPLFSSRISLKIQEVAGSPTP